MLGRTGQPFWPAESYDHSVRDDRESDRMKSGRVANAEDYL